MLAAPSNSLKAATTSGAATGSGTSIRGREVRKMTMIMRRMMMSLMKICMQPLMMSVKRTRMRARRKMRTRCQHLRRRGGGLSWRCGRGKPEGTREVFSSVISISAISGIVMGIGRSRRALGNVLKVEAGSRK